MANEEARHKACGRPRTNGRGAEWVAEMVPGSMEIVHEGMLKKAPPPKRLWRAKWRMRWFVLRSGELPGQYFLEYYTDQTRRKLKGKIDLDQCDQVDAGIAFSNPKLEYKYMFDIKTPKRVYFLCAETEQEMNRWVDCVCHVCGLKIYSQEDEYPPLPLDHISPTPSATPPTPLHSLPHDPELDSPSLSPSSPGSSISGPYIPISTCFTGKRTPNTSSSFPFGDDIPPIRGSENHRSSIPNEMAPPIPVICPDSQPPLMQAPSPPAVNTGAIPRETYDGHRQMRPGTSEDTLSVKSPLGTDGSSVFSEDELPSHSNKIETKFFGEGSRIVTGNTYAKEGHQETPAGGVGALVSDLHGIGLSDDDHQKAAPPRPPKPAHLAEIPHQTYQNLETVSRTALVRRNSSNEKMKNGLGCSLTVSDVNIVASGPEPSPASVNSSLPPSSPREISEDPHGVVIRSQQFSEAASPKSADRPKQRYCFNNAVLTPKQSQVFSYDLRHHDKSGDHEPIDPRISPAGAYSNISQTNRSPPAVDRGLKPRKTSEGSNLGSSDLSPPPSGGGISDLLGAVGGSPALPSSAPPVVDRNLKPVKIPPEPLTRAFELDPPPTRSTKHKSRAAPSPTPPFMHNGRGNADSGEENDLVSSPDSRRNSSNAEEQLKYLDLDHATRNPQTPKPNKIIVAPPPSVDYREVDFFKTYAFNKCKENVEDTYRKNQ
ncbi:Protein daughter of sevenless [Portunus trituberculatus]|uniref:Protein daughter of sevenless n=2 Tax=Portunus trituberculatus TaxID=210409 RepID=A0A5B7E0J5_PORTR|nr:Protein daughter of sevenless [Portunus trituberculatus]